MWTLTLLLIFTVGGWQPQPVFAELPAFHEIVIDDHAGEICYAVTAADVNNDQRPDIVVVTERQVLCYEAPEWKKTVILDGVTLRDNVCIAPLDIDQDGRVDFALGAGWTKTGTIQWLGRDQGGSEKWSVHMIGEELWTHRMRFADVLGKGRPQLVVSPLNKSTGDGVHLTAFEIPARPRTDRWPSTVLNNRLNRMHNHWHADFDGDGRADTLTASAEGVSVIHPTPDGFAQKLLPLVDGAVHDGAGEIKLGQFGGPRHPFIATIEPMHGTSLVVYEPTPSGGWSKATLVNTLNRGHALWLADLDQDRDDEIVMGHSDPATGDIKGPGVYIFDRTKTADGSWQWQRHSIDDGGVACEDALAVDFTGDGWIDIVACGRATHNVKLYVNSGRTASR